MAERALTPVVGKATEAGIVVLFIGLLTTTLFGGVVPGAERAAGDAVGDRTLAQAGERVQQAVPPATRSTDVTMEVAIPRTIAGQAYQIETDGEELALHHPDPGIGGQLTLALPTHVEQVAGTWTSRADTVIRVTEGDDGVVIRLVSR